MEWASISTQTFNSKSLNRTSTSLLTRPLPPAPAAQAARSTKVEPPGHVRSLQKTPRTNKIAFHWRKDVNIPRSLPRGAHKESGRLRRGESGGGRRCSSRGEINEKCLRTVRKLDDLQDWRVNPSSRTQRTLSRVWLFLRHCRDFNTSLSSVDLPLFDERTRLEATFSLV